MEQLYWNIENFSGSTFSLMQESKDKIFTEKLSIKDVEKHFGKKVKVCPAHRNPDLIINAMVEENGTKFLDRRKSLRGNTYRCFLFN